MNLYSRLVVAGLIALIAALALPAQARAYVRARHQIELVRQWHQARLELQLMTMDFPENAQIWEPTLARMNWEGMAK